MPGTTASIAAAVFLLLTMAWYFIQRKNTPTNDYEKQREQNEKAVMDADKHPDDVNALLDERINRLRPSEGDSPASGQVSDPNASR